jgi:hypothetical protein
VAGFNPTWTLRGSGEGQMNAMGHEPVTVVPVTLTFITGDTYLTGGMTVTLPDELSERSVDWVIVLTPEGDAATDGVRTWFWSGSTNKLIANDAFSTEEGNATSIAGVVLQLLVGIK